MTKEQIIDDTVEYYSKNPRATVFGGCLYLTPDGRKCAHSRCLDLSDDKLMELRTSSASNVILKLGDEIHKIEYRGHHFLFWVDIQNLHDQNNFWRENGLSEEGEKYVNYLKEKYGE